MGNPVELGLTVQRKRHIRADGLAVQMSCHHEPVRGGRPLRCCGGCLARVVDVLKRVRAGDSLELIDALFAQMRAEGEALASGADA
jgi:hypothetical protein